MALPKKKLIFSIFIVVVLFAIVLNPQKYISTANYAIEVWAKVLLPSLLPFFIFTKLLTSFGYVESASKCFKKVTYKLYKCPPISCYVFLMSVLSGYPVGSKIVGDLYQNGQISKTQAKKIITFTSNSGPMFILGSVGIGMLASKTCGYIMYFSHILGAIFNGLLYRNLSEKDDKNTNYLNAKNNSNSVLSQSIMDAISSIMLIGGTIVVAFIVIEILNTFDLFFPIVWCFKKIGISEQISNTFVSGFFEITKGCLMSSSLNNSTYAKTIITCGIISFGGISTTLQAMAFLKDISSYKFFVLQKITHMILSVSICAILGLVFF